MRKFNRNSILFFVFSALIVSLSINVNAANFLRADNNGLVIFGPIQQGDYIKFKQALRTFERPPIIKLASTGGELFEALKMGRLIRQLKLSTEAPTKGSKHVCGFSVWSAPEVDSPNVYGKRCVCASACFFLWASGAERKTGDIAVHRASAEGDEVAKMTLSQYSKMYDEGQEEMQNFLNEMGFPPKWYDLISSIPSTEFYPLSYKEQTELRETWPTSTSEWVLTKCTNLSPTERAARETLLYGDYNDTLTNEEEQFFEALQRKKRKFGSCRTNAIGRQSELAFSKFRSLTKSSDTTPYSGWSSDEFRKHIDDTDNPEQLLKLLTNIPERITQWRELVIFPTDTISKVKLTDALNEYVSSFEDLNESSIDGNLWLEYEHTLSNLRFFTRYWPDLNIPWSYISSRVTQFYPRFRYKSPTAVEDALSDYSSAIEEEEGVEFDQRVAAALPLARQVLEHNPKHIRALVIDLVETYRMEGSVSPRWSFEPDELLSAVTAKKLGRFLDRLSGVYASNAGERSTKPYAPFFDAFMALHDTYPASALPIFIKFKHALMLRDEKRLLSLITAAANALPDGVPLKGELLSGIEKAPQ